jgi:hypothetical protein
MKKNKARRKSGQRMKERVNHVPPDSFHAAVILHLCRRMDRRMSNRTLPSVTVCLVLVSCLAEIESNPSHFALPTAAKVSDLRAIQLDLLAFHRYSDNNFEAGMPK